MSLLNITKVSDTGEQCWGVVLLDDMGATLLRSEKGVRKGEVTSIAKTLKFEGPGAAIVVEGAGKPEGPAWVLEKTDHGWLVRFTLVDITAFDLTIKPGAGAAPPEAAEEALKAVKDCLAHANIEWDPPEADPAYEEKVTDETEIVGIPGSRARLSAAMQEKLNRFVNWKQAQIPVLEGSRVADPRLQSERGAATAVDCIRLRVRAQVLDDGVEDEEDRRGRTQFP